MGDNVIKIAYICDQKRECSSQPNFTINGGECEHTLDIKHAKNFHIVVVEDPDGSIREEMKDKKLPFTTDDEGITTMTRTRTTCDICGEEVFRDDGVKADGHEGFTNLRRKYPRQISIIFDEFDFDNVAPSPTTYDLCLECSMELMRFIRKKQFDSQKIPNL